MQVTGIILFQGIIVVCIVIELRDLIHANGIIAVNRKAAEQFGYRFYRIQAALLSAASVPVCSADLFL